MFSVSGRAFITRSIMILNRDDDRKIHADQYETIVSTVYYNSIAIAKIVRLYHPAQA